MKTKILKHYLLLFTILLGLIVSFNGCSDDDDEPQTFLEKYDGTIWSLCGKDIYIRFNDNMNKFIEEWDGDVDCYYYSNWDTEFIEFIKNSKDRLVIKITEEGESETITFTVQGDVLKGVVNDNLDELSYFNKTSVNVDGFEICD